MTTLMQASRQWASRPDDQRFTSLDDMLAFKAHQREISRQSVIASRRIEAQPIASDPTHAGLQIVGVHDQPVVPNHWSFGQLCERVKAPASYLRTLPAPMVADLLNYGVFKRDVEDVGILTRGEDDQTLAAATGPRYGRVWDYDVIKAIRDRFGDGVTGDFRVPGEFGREVRVTKDNTTLYASDRDMFVFLADEKNRIEVPGRRNGKPGSLARGFFVWNSEVGSKTLGIGTFLFDFVCSNRIVWGAEGYEEIKIMHFKSAEDRWMEEVAPAIEAYAEKSTQGIRQAIEDARAKRVSGDALDDFLKRRFTAGQVEGIKAAHFADEDRPMENLWDVTTGVTAYARGIKHQDARIDLERKAGKIMAMGS